MSADLGKPLSILLCNQNWFADTLREAGHTVISVGQKRRGFDLELLKPGITVEKLLASLPRAFEVDRLVYFDDSGPLWITGLDRSPVPTVFYSVDCHHHVQWHAYLASTFDRVLIAQRDYLPSFRKFHSDVSWFPLWAPTVPPPAPERDLDVCFRGTFNEKLNPKRIKFFNELRKHINVDAGPGEWRTTYPRAKIVINQAVKADFNFRVFEALVTGALLITPTVDNGMLDLFTPDEDLVTYEVNNIPNALEKIRYYLEHPIERMRIADNGLRKVLSYHTESARGVEFERIVRELSITPRNQHHLGLGMAYVASASICDAYDPLLGAMYLKLASDEIIAALETNEQSKGNLEKVAMMAKNGLYAHRSIPIAQKLAACLVERFPDNCAYQEMYRQVKDL